MKTFIIKIISYLALLGTIVPSLLVFFGDMELQANKNIMAVSMVVWFVTAPLWINKKSEEEVAD
jgi:hypothetical protein